MLISLPADGLPAAPGQPVMSLPRQTERQFQQQVYDLARLLGWLAYHALRSEHSAAGFPDLIMARHPRIIAAELKRDGEAPTDDQRVWLAELKACGLETYVWRPADWPTITRILGR
jgi:hypothetical protein